MEFDLSIDGPEDCLYHYCSTSTLVSIIDKNAIWLSSLSLSNDYAEGKLVAQTFQSLLEDENVDEKKVKAVIKAAEKIQRLYDCLGFCLSENPDLLSQWRGYADDGQGFAVGFSKKYLEMITRKNKNHYLSKVKYKPDEHRAAVQKVFEFIKKRIIDTGLPIARQKLDIVYELDPDNLMGLDQEHEEALEKLLYTIQATLPSMFTLKNKAFEEEVEWRLISYIENRNHVNVGYRSAGNKIIPYRVLDLPDYKLPRITHIFVGPKNITPTDVVENYLRLNGHLDVMVHRSSATYR